MEAIRRREWVTRLCSGDTIACWKAARSGGFESICKQFASETCSGAFNITVLLFDIFMIFLKIEKRRLVLDSGQVKIWMRSSKKQREETKKSDEQKYSQLRTCYYLTVCYLSK